MQFDIDLEKERTEILNRYRGLLRDCRESISKEDKKLIVKLLTFRLMHIKTCVESLASLTSTTLLMSLE